MKKLIAIVTLLLTTTAEAQLPPGLSTGNSIPGVIQPPVTSSSSSSVISAPDEATSGSLINVGDTLQMPLSGHQGVGFTIVGLGAVLGTVVAETTTDAGATWNSAPIVVPSATSLFWRSSASANNASSLTGQIVVVGGTTDVRLRMTTAGNGLSVVINTTNLPNYGLPIGIPTLSFFNNTNNSVGVITHPYTGLSVVSNSKLLPSMFSDIVRANSGPFTLEASATFTPPVVTATVPPQPVMTFSPVGLINSTQFTSAIIDSVIIQINGGSQVQAAGLIGRVVKRRLMYASTTGAAPAAGAAPTIAAVAFNGSALSGTFQYKCVAVDPWGYEGNYTAASLNFTPGANQGATVTCPAVPAGAVGYNIYRTYAGPSATFYFLGRTNNTTYTDIIGDTMTLAAGTIGAWGTTPPSTDSLTVLQPLEMIFEVLSTALASAPTKVHIGSYPKTANNNRVVTIAPPTAIGSRYRILGEDESKSFLTTTTAVGGLYREYDANYPTAPYTQMQAAFGHESIIKFDKSDATIGGKFVVWGQNLLGITTKTTSYGMIATTPTLAMLSPSEGSVLRMDWVSAPIVAGGEEMVVEIGSSTTAASISVTVYVTGRLL